MEIQIPITTHPLNFTRRILDYEIPGLKSFEDFALFLAQAFETDEVYHLDILLNALPTWGNQVTEENVAMLEPAFENMFERVIRQKRKLENIILGLVSAYMEHVESKYPCKSRKLEKLKTQALEIDEEYARDCIGYKRFLMPFEKRIMPYSFTGFWKIGIYAIEKMRNNDPLPLLSTPTHLPIWIDPIVLINRIACYQENNRNPHDMDMQLALQRCRLSNTAEALKLAKHKLKGEIKDLMLFLLNPEASPNKTPNHPAWWITAEITRSPDMYSNTPYTWDIYTMPAKPGIFGHQEYQAIRINTPPCRHNEHSYDLFMQYTLNAEEDHLYYARPHLLDDAYASIVKEIQTLVFVWDEEPLLAIHYAKMLQQFHTPLREMHYLFLAVCLLGPHATLRKYGVQIYLDKVSNGTMDSAWLERTIEKMKAGKAAPPKRFTNISNNSMIRISQPHNSKI
ncbi:DUF6493 family protein [Bacteroides sp. 51]|uniref:DUF7824 domain-containing protein n=1 Tax=Bacteroides sp. 51 TaxID=2302938 RepID=UPI0013D8B2FC|nr:DUF6493 family protein [Bacteroides sp. 51]NDV84746.1 hypothetical protein [Bacteroides sp. 51]